MKLLGLNTYIESRLVVKGRINAFDIVKVFGVTKKTAGKEIGAFNKLYPSTINYCRKTHTWLLDDLAPLNKNLSVQDAERFIANIEMLHEHQSPILSFLECEIQLRGKLARKSIASKFGVTTRTVTALLKNYNQMRATNLVIKENGMNYQPSFTFLPLFIKSVTQAKEFEQALDEIMLLR
ncbi:hypothetical protein VroAM7_50510 (plasmid) [Vibrio rotiferianus]|uniref:DNA-binding transcriptional repressor CapW winged helix-turn-helix domain-containing protein n=1 Tax=Vibrio rotiferianus TaxID=190895 RepID=A0A510IH04_9VIBR|nr:hypothetical protein VroAM7_50510 [Vibrio rotiferianus]